MDDEIRMYDRTAVRLLGCWIFAARGWAVVQLDLDEGGEPWYAMYGAMPTHLCGDLVSLLGTVSLGRACSRPHRSSPSSASFEKW